MSTSPHFPTPAAITVPPPAGAGGVIRRLFATVGITAALTVGGVALPASASAAEAPTGVSTARVVTGWCPFGTHGGSGGGCRGGSINDNARANDAARDTARMYGDAAECAARALGKSALRNKKRPTPATIGLGTIRPGIKCGRSKGY